LPFAAIEALAWITVSRIVITALTTTDTRHIEKYQSKSLLPKQI